MESVDLRKIRVAPDAIKRIPEAIARRYRLLPLAERGSQDQPELILAFRDFEGESEQERLESVLAVLETIEDTVGVVITPFFATDTEAFDQLHRRIYPDRRGLSTVGSEALLRDMINLALIQRASDIHIDADDQGGRISFRIDGRISEIRRLNDQELDELTAIVKIKADLDIAERRAPMDGAIRFELSGEEVSLRLATIPTINGEHLTLRLLTANSADDLSHLENLCFSEEHLTCLRGALGEPGGIIAVSGPTGSGKTTTLYAALRYLRDLGGRHIVSLEDPVEKPVRGITQVKIDDGGQRVTFHKALRSVLRHDPDVILIGEIRDQETAEIAVRAALTGHLVLSTLHTNDALGVITRLLDLGVPEYLLASTLRLAMAQRLVRRPSTHGLEWVRACDEDCSYIGCDVAEAPLLPHPGASPFDGGTGYSGRAAIYEMVPVDARLRSLIAERALEGRLADYVFGERGLHTLKSDGVAKALQGLTTLSEVRAVAGMR